MILGILAALLLSGWAPPPGTVNPGPHVTSGARPGLEGLGQPPDVPIVASAAAPQPSAGPSVLGTLVLYNNTYVAGDYLSVDGRLPSAVTLDPVSGLLYVANGGASGIAVVDPSVGEVVGAQGGCGSTPNSVLFNARYNELYSGCPGLNRVTISNLTSGGITANISLPASPVALTYNPWNGEVLVSLAYTDGLVVLNRSAQIGTIATGDLEFYGGYDTTNHRLFFGGEFNVTVVNAKNNSVVGSVTGTTGAAQTAYDPVSNRIFTADYLNASTTVINATSRKALAHLPLAGFANSVAIDTRDNLVFVSTDVGPTSNVTVFNGSTDAQVAILATGENWLASTEGGQLVYDPPRDTVYAAERAPNAIGAFPAAPLRVAPPIWTWAEPHRAVYDPTTRQIFVTEQGAFTNNSSSDRVLQINGTTHRIVGYLPVGGAPFAIAADPGTSSLVVANSLQWPSKGNLSFVDPRSGRTTGRTSISDLNVGEIGYDPASGSVYVLDSYLFGTRGDVVNDTSHLEVGNFSAGPGPDGFAYDPANRAVYISNLNGANVTVINGTTNLRLTTIADPGCSPSSEAYDPTNHYLYVGDSYSANVSVIDTRTNTWLRNITLAAAPTMVLGVDGRNGDVYLSTGGNVSVLNATNAVVATLARPASAPAFGSIVYDPSARELYAPEVLTSSVGVLQPRNAPPPPSSFPVTFSESGLPGGTSWTVVFRGNTTTASAPAPVAFSSTNGSFAFRVSAPAGYTITPLSGVVDVAGAGVTQAVQFARNYSLVFTETGLSVGAPWSVDLSGMVHPVSMASVGFALPNGTYAFSIPAVPGFVANVTSGNAQIQGENATVAIGFRSTAGRPTFAVTFAETGLTTGSRWWVTLNGSEMSATGATIRFLEPNGTLSYNLSGPAGERAAVAMGQVTVTGNPTSVSVTFTANSSVPGTQPISSPPGWGSIGLGLLGVAIVVVIGLVLLLWRRRRIPPAAPSLPPPQAAPPK